MSDRLPPPERRMTRAHVAKFVGISKSSVRRLEGGALTPIRTADDTCGCPEGEPLLIHMLRKSPMDLRSVTTLMNEFATGHLTLDETHALIMQVAEAAPKRLVAAYDQSVAAREPSASGD